MDFDCLELETVTEEKGQVLGITILKINYDTIDLRRKEKDLKCML